MLMKIFYIVSKKRVRTYGGEQWVVRRTPPQSVDRCPMSVQLHDRLPRTPHVQDLHVLSVLMERRHVIRVCRIECDAQQRRRMRSRGLRGGLGRRGDVFRGRGLVQNRRVFETAEIEGAEGPVCADGDEDVGGPGQPCDVVDFSIVCDELRDGGGGVDVPYGTRRVY